MIAKQKQRTYADFATRLNQACADHGISESNRAAYLARLVTITRKGAEKWLKGELKND